MCEACNHTRTIKPVSLLRLAGVSGQSLGLHAYQYDPTRTTALRNAFAQQMSNRFNALARVIRQAVDTEDCFGLRSTTIAAPTILQGYALETPGAGAFAYPRSSDKVNAFMKWLRRQVDRGVLEIGTFEQVGTGIEPAWTNRYLTDSYKRGVQRARYELKKAGFAVPSIQETGGIDVSMSTPFHIDRLGLIYTRVFNDLRGITTQMDTQISRVLAQGLADGDGPRLLARKLVATITDSGAGDLGLTDTLGRFIPAKRRAETLARTEVIRAHHLANVQEYRNWAVEGVIVQAEWSTAGDNRVCPICSDLNGEIFTLDQIEKMLPRHPNCRCIALPFKVSEFTQPDFPYRRVA